MFQNIGLHRLAYLALFPVELRLTTAGAQVRDRLWLRGGGDRVPPASAAAALAASLDALVQNSRAIRPG